MQQHDGPGRGVQQQQDESETRVQQQQNEPEISGRTPFEAQRAEVGATTTNNLDWGPPLPSKAGITGPELLDMLKQRLTHALNPTECALPDNLCCQLPLCKVDVCKVTQ